MARVVRVILAIVAGFAVSFVLVVAVEAFSSVVHPLPADFDGTNEAVCEHVANYPPWVLAVVVPLWGVTAFAGTWVAGRLGNRGSALFLGVLLLAAVLFNLSMLPYPLWFQLVQPVVIVGAVWLACRRSRRTRAEVASPQLAG
ncbi:MAG: hypothetical protein KDA79_13145 [Planctomycetaceae bacterium]|nr:hypothetical protein [Planctomycetaceae bacterium]